MIDKSKIKAGDQVKIEYKGLVSKDWTAVTAGMFGDLKFGEFYLVDGNLTVTDHKPNLSQYENAVKEAEEALAKAKIALAEAKNPKSIPVGTPVLYSSSYRSGKQAGVVVGCPDEYASIDDVNKIWVVYDDPDFTGKSATWTTADRLTVLR